MSNPSPLRYPGGKYKISKLIELLLNKAGDRCSTYIEPFAGGAGIAIDLLLRGVVSDIVINDSDPAIAAFWKAVVCANDAFIDKIDNTPVTLAEWHRQREIYSGPKKYSIDLGFSTFFLNRTNHSGILASGPIGGQKQEVWKLNVRYNKEDLIKKIESIGRHRKHIHLSNQDVLRFMVNQLKRHEKSAFVYFDPPYYRKGKVLYQNFFDDQKHRLLCERIKSEVGCPWIVSYDDVPEINAIYKDFPRRSFSLNYSLANNGYGAEAMFFKDESLVPTRQEIDSVGMLRQFYPTESDEDMV